VRQLALRAGKPVLVEKPFTVTAAEAEELVALARSKGLFLMEAMWTRWLPHIVAIRELLAEGALGEIVLVTADHGQWFAPDRDFRMHARELHSGALARPRRLSGLVRLDGARHARSASSA
jgi:predicted dehydrogenase